ncbi:MAG: 3-carboxy-cis,cis-muconate cycloisomerase [Neomegalonema sp.]|nr:3-carboxy-cis,cis-muconate cycloisomerase [Neomegalonema sp.]
MPDLFEHPWLSGLFGDDEAAYIWSPGAQIGHYLAFEAALARALEAAGRVAPGSGARAAAAIEGFAPDLAGLAAGTAQDGLPVPALVKQLRAAAGEDSAAVHTGSTSQDVLDTALSLTLRAQTDLMLARLARILAALGALEQRFGAAALIGRTRMQAALPITAADRLRSWRAPLADLADALRAERAQVERLQLGGAVGTNAAFGADAGMIAQSMATALGLTRAPHVWHTDRSALVQYGARLSQISGALGKIGQDVCLMALQGIDEIKLAGGGGSSAMPHKSNPILAELLVSLARYNAAQLGGLAQVQLHEQERSGTAWTLEWMLVPPMALSTARSLAAAEALLGQIKRIGPAEPEGGDIDPARRAGPRSGLPEW